MNSSIDKVVPLKGMRKMIADKMHSSLQNSAQVTHCADAVVDSLLARKSRLEPDGVKVSMQDLLYLAVISTLRNHPDLNGKLEKDEIHLSKSINLSMAIALPGGLLVAPAVFEADQMDLESMRQARVDITDRALNNKLTVPEMTGGSITVSNLGLSRVRYFTPILNSPQIAIIGFGCTDEVLILHEDGSVGKKTSMGISLTFDHRAVDGAPAAAFLSELCNCIESGGIG